jgi:hypothetical protein
MTHRNRNPLGKKQQSTLKDACEAPLFTELQVVKCQHCMKHKCLHNKYVSAEFRRDNDKNYWSIDRFWRVLFGNKDIIRTCEDCGQNISNLYLTRYEK